MAHTATSLARPETVLHGFALARQTLQKPAGGVHGIATIPALAKQWSRWQQDGTLFFPPPTFGDFSRMPIVPVLFP